MSEPSPTPSPTPSLARRFRRGAIRLQLLTLLLLSATSGFLAEQLAGPADRLAAAYQDADDDRADPPGTGHPRR
ncbi:hypothetical protein ACFFMP_08285 [Pseudoroseomonas cervicalis]|uniref:Uncharacterized protein n=1 Tax=Pseudoroseomonas cervicalis ATCC 49957 TaxID=525371 RepID=D5RTC3_9PROT|nr:hypothetical protein [Pseudoroseomonas cervicalis]EFH09453.1 hypothetical protein HMPREF0731_4335 [Pseudoroseomonas cervicalis ATCC 49957]